MFHLLCFLVLSASVSRAEPGLPPQKPSLTFTSLNPSTTPNIKAHGHARGAARA